MQPLSTFASKGYKSIFNFKEISVKGIWLKLIFVRKINDIGLSLNWSNQKVCLQPFEVKVRSGCIITTYF